MNTQKRLTRSTEDRMFAGVCGGIAEYLEIDPTLVRLFFAALTLLASGSGIILYIILMLIVPEQPRTKQKPVHHNTYDNPSEESAVIRSSEPVADDTLAPTTASDQTPAEPRG